MTVIAFDPIVSNLVFTANLILHLRAPASSEPFKKPLNNRSADDLPHVSVLIPLFKEELSSILATTRSLAAQTYPADKLEALFIVEPDDITTRKYVEEHALRLLEDRGIWRAKIVVSDGEVRLKPHALNQGLRKAMGDIVCVYDADDTFPETQIEDAVNLMLEDGYDVLQPKVYRARDSLVGRFPTIDAFVWQRAR